MICKVGLFISRSSPFSPFAPPLVDCQRHRFVCNEGMALFPHILVHFFFLFDFVARLCHIQSQFQFVHVNVRPNELGARSGKSSAMVVRRHLHDCITGRRHIHASAAPATVAQSVEWMRTLPFPSPAGCAPALRRTFYCETSSFFFLSPWISFDLISMAWNLCLLFFFVASPFRFNSLPLSLVFRLVFIVQSRCCCFAWNIYGFIIVMRQNRGAQATDCVFLSADTNDGAFPNRFFNQNRNNDGNAEHFLRYVCMCVD